MNSTGQLCSPARESDAHYHFRVARTQAAEPSFLPCSPVIPDGLPPTECHKTTVIVGFWPEKALLHNLGNSLAAGKYRICYWELS